MRVLTSVIEIPTLTVFHPGQDLPLRRAVALQFVCNDDAGHVLEPLEQLTKELLRRLLVAATLHQDVEHVIVLIHGAPQVMALPIDRQKHLVEVPLVPWLGASTLQLIGVLLPKLATPLADGFMGEVDPAFEQQLLYITVAQREAIVEPDSVGSNIRLESLPFIGVPAPSPAI